MTGPGVFGTYVDRSYEKEVVEALIRLVQPGWNVVDVGGHLGYFTLLLARLIGEKGRTIAFEAHPENAKWLQKNVQLNRLEGRVKTENLAVSDGSQSIVRLNAPRHYTNTWSILKPSFAGHFLEVDAVSLDQYFANGPPIHFLKIDIERAEYLALQGMRQLIERDRPICMVELHDNEGHLAARFLDDMAYRLTDMSNHNVFDSLFSSRLNRVLAWPADRSE